MTSIACASEKGHDKVVEILLSSGANVNIQDVVSSLCYLLLLFTMQLDCVLNLNFLV